MQVAAKQRLGGLGLLVAAALVGTVLSSPIEWVSTILLCAAAVIGIALWAVRGDLLTAVLIWFASVISFDEEFWRVPVPFFFNVTISRILIVVLGAIWVGMWITGRMPIRTSTSVPRIMAVILVYFTLSAAVTGFQTISVATVHYRLIGGFWFAFAVFFFVLHSVQTETHLMRLLKFFFLVGVYLTVTGWCEYFELWDFVFPQYIADPTKGIHWGRVRGPFLVSPTMGVALTFCLFNNLVLARRLAGPGKTAVYAASLLMLPAIFWTQTRSVWLSLILGVFIWLTHTHRRWTRLIALSALAAVALVVLTANIENVLTPDRTRGGVTDVEPIYVRVGLALITWDIFKDRPIFGVGFGHFRDEAPAHARRVDSPFYAFASSAMEHNNFLTLLAETGLVGLLLYLLLLYVILRTSIRLYRRLPESAPGPVSRDLLALYWVLFMVHIVDGMCRETSVHPFANSLFFGMSGVVAALEWLLRPQPVRREASWSASAILRAGLTIPGLETAPGSAR